MELSGSVHVGVKIIDAKSALPGSRHVDVMPFTLVVEVAKASPEAPCTYVQREHCVAQTNSEATATSLPCFIPPRVIRYERSSSL